MAAENYHLKWDSHMSYLNSSVATLYKNEKFADVMLYSSSSISNTCNGSVAESGIPTVGISAHKFILSSCSQFFATMFEASPIASPNGVLFVVLPPELSHRAIQILVQYMYSGEATVSNDILSEVLRGGELLKIRGLCRTSSSLHLPHHHHQNSTSNVPNYGTNGTRALPSTSHCSTQPAPSTHTSDPYTNAKCSSTRYLIEHQQHQFRGLGASVMPKDSPVIVKSPKMPPLAMLPAPSSNKHLPVGGGGGSGISINKEVAIDPEEKCCYSGNNQVMAEPLTNENDSSICTGMGCNSCSLSSAVEREQLRRRQRSHSDEQMTAHHAMGDQLEREHAHYQDGGNSLASSGHCERLENEESQDERVMGYERRIRRNSGNDRGSGYYLSEHYDHSTSTTASKHYTDAISRLPASPPQPHNFLSIKQEPNDWTTSSTLEGNNATSGHRTTSPTTLNLSPKQPLDFKMPLAAVKIEAASTHSADEEETLTQSGGGGGDYDTFTRLICEVCKESFDDPKIWVRHLESHASAAAIESQHQTEMSAENCIASNAAETLAKSYVPKKRRRVSQQENSMDHVTLLCDICSTSFETPAEWVRHMNNQHTEIELAMFNSKKDNEQQQKTQTNSSGTSVNASQHKKSMSRASSHGYMEYADKVCDICNKKFSSNSAMLLHKRSHNSGHLNASSLSASSPITGRQQQQQANGISNRELQSPA